MCTLEGLPRRLSNNLPVNAGAAGDAGTIPGLGRSLRVGKDNPLQYSCWDNPTDRGPSVHGLSKSRTRLTTHSRTLGTSFIRTWLPTHPHASSTLGLMDISCTCGFRLGKYAAHDQTNTPQTDDHTPLPTQVAPPTHTQGREATQGARGGASGPARFPIGSQRCLSGGAQRLPACTSGCCFGGSWRRV